MKRCSHCEFIYEDEQHLCDMDGHDLVYEPTLQALQLSTATPAAELSRRPAKSRVRHQALAAAIAVVIATVLSVGYSAFTRDYAPPTITAPTTNVITAPQPTDLTPVTPAVSPTPAPSYSPPSEKTGARPASTSPDRTTPNSRVAVLRREPVRSQPGKTNPKKESGIGGFLKKTGKVLKRPFKF